MAAFIVAILVKALLPFVLPKLRQPYHAKPRTDVMVYWTTQSITSSCRLYYAASPVAACRSAIFGEEVKPWHHFAHGMPLQYFTIDHSNDRRVNWIFSCDLRRPWLCTPRQSRSRLGPRHDTLGSMSVCPLESFGHMQRSSKCHGRSGSPVSSGLGIGVAKTSSPSLSFIRKGTALTTLQMPHAAGTCLSSKGPLVRLQLQGVKSDHC